MKTLFLATLLLFMSGGVDINAAQPRPVTDARLQNPEPESWLMYRGNYNGWGYSPLKQIDTQNVGDLVPAWTLSTGVDEGHQSPPVVNDGVMYITTPGNQVLALDAASGDLLWRYRRELPDDVLNFHPTNRGVALYGGRVYFGGVDAFLVALDAASGELVWETAVENYKHGYYLTLAPLVVHGKVMVGISGGELGVRGFVAAYDADTGDQVWKTYTIPGPGEPGHDTWPGDTWKTGGAPVWVTGTYDPELNLTYWGTGNAAPWMGDTRPGDNLYSSSVVAIDADSGELRAHHQYHWNDSWDWDEVDAPMLIDITRDGETVKSLVHPGRNGYLWLLSRQRDAIGFVDAWPFVHQDVFTRLDPETGRPEYHPDRKPGTGKEARLPLYVHGRSGGDVRAREILCGPTRAAKSRHADPRQRRNGWGASSVGCGSWRARVDEELRFTELGPRLDDRRRARLHGRHERSLLSGLRRADRRRSLGDAHEFRHHRRSELLRRGRRAVHRGAVRLGRRRAEDAFEPHRVAR